jgi:lipoyl(octanoyl) transferase
MMTQESNEMVEWIVEKDIIPYESAEIFMKTRAADIASGEASERIWLLEHPALYTAGTSAKPEDLVSPDRFPVFKTGRGGQYTYHGPGQRVAYVMLNLKERNPDVRAFVRSLEDWIIATLARFDIKGERRPGRVGIWVVRNKGTAAEREDKIAAIGIRLHKWVSFHGISINVAPDLEHFSGIVPCGIDEHGVTSFKDLEVPATMEELDSALREEFENVFSDR